MPIADGTIITTTTTTERVIRSCALLDDMITKVIPSNPHDRGDLCKKCGGHFGVISRHYHLRATVFQRFDLTVGAQVKSSNQPARERRGGCGRGRHVQTPRRQGNVVIFPTHRDHSSAIFILIKPGCVIVKRCPIVLIDHIGMVAKIVRKLVRVVQCQ